MLTNRVAATDANDNDRLMGLLAYLLTPIVPIIILLVDTMKVRPYQKYHAIQALGVFVVIFVLSIVLTVCTFGIGGCLAILFVIPAIYYAIIAYQGAYFDIPWMSNFMRQQGWLPPAGGGAA